MPPAARKSQGGFAAAAARGQAAATAAKPNGRATPTGPAASATPPPAAKSPQPTAPAMSVSASTNPAIPVPGAATGAEQGLSVPQAAAPARSNSDGPTPAAAPTSANITNAASPSAEKSPLPADGASMAKTESKVSLWELHLMSYVLLTDSAGRCSGQLPAIRRYRARTCRGQEAVDAENRAGEAAGGFKEVPGKFQGQFGSTRLAIHHRRPLTVQVALPVPKDMLSILSKDEAKQKEIEAKAAQTVLEGQRANEARKLASPKVGTSFAATPVKSPSSSKKLAMKIQEIPTFDALKKKKPPTLPVPETAGQNIALATSPSASEVSASAQPRLNPKATTFSFKPNPSAAAFKPGQPSSTVTSPNPQATATLAPAPAPAPVATSAAGPSVSLIECSFSETS